MSPDNTLHTPAVAQSPIIGGVPLGALAWWLLKRPGPKKTLVLLNDEEKAAGLVDDLNALGKIPADWDKLTDIDALAYPADDEAVRAMNLFEWTYGKASILVTSSESWEHACDLPDQLKKRVFSLKPGWTSTRSEFEDRLSKAGYSRVERTEQIGEYSVRGDVIDIWPPVSQVPLRIIWNFDTVEAIRKIDPGTQRSETYLREVTIHPVLMGGGASLKDFVSSDTEVICYDWSPAPSNLNEMVSSIKFVGPTGTTDQGFQPAFVFSGHTNQLRDQLVKWHEDDWKVLIFCHNRGEKDRLEELLADPIASAKGLLPPWLPPIIIGELERGFCHPFDRRAILTNSEIFGRYRKKIRLPKFDAGETIASPLDIHANDYLVHEKYGIGRYAGLQSLRVGNVQSEYLTMEYKGGDKLYVPIFEIQQVQKYLGAEDRRPALSSLDTASWERLKSKVKEDVAKIAAQLLRQAAQRHVRPGHAFPPQSHLEKEFGESFLYKLTPDQIKTLEEVEVDMTSSKAMDRLICGDVGYGKTEIAMRAALKAALSGKQVAFLCPTTILAEQHYRNFSDRMADYPVTLALLSRFQDKSEQKKILESVTKGGTDIIIGTHRLLSADVSFSNVGLIIIDEEHRFGVKQKNKLLAFRETVDVLSLTATPIPRTLASSLAGIKDLSVIETPPEGRHPISTYVGVFDEDVMTKAVQQELDRGGQVFYVHNHVKTLLARKKWLMDLLPSIRIVMAHGQMKENELETAMYDFLHKKVDILLATTIIESGLDIPTVNTLIVEDADQMGLAQLYQLRGRVGRSKTKATCLLFYSSDGLTTDAKKRLEALKEFTALGSGFRLAMRDMEIRGAGNLLGPQQHGNMAAVGVETYSQLLNEEIQTLKGELVDEQPLGPVLELSISAYIPADYLPSESERVQMYKRILSSSHEGLDKLKEELVDRCGPLPEPVHLLFEAAQLRSQAKEKGISEVHQEQESIRILFKSQHRLSDKQLNTLLALGSDKLQFLPGSPNGIRFYIKGAESGLSSLKRFLELMS